MTNTEATMQLERIREAATLLTDLEKTFLPLEARRNAPSFSCFRRSTDLRDHRGVFCEVGLSHEGLLSSPEFLERLNHSGARSFGLIIEIFLEALGEAVGSGSKALTVDHFADVYYVRTNCEDDMNPLVFETWLVIDSRKAMDRWIEESKN